MAGIGVSGILLLTVVALILFGPKKLPELGRAVGSTLQEFKKGTKEILSDDEQEDIIRKASDKKEMHTSATANERMEDNL